MSIASDIDAFRQRLAVKDAEQDKLVFQAGEAQRAVPAVTHGISELKATGFQPFRDTETLADGDDNDNRQSSAYILDFTSDPLMEIYDPSLQEYVNNPTYVGLLPQDPNTPGSITVTFIGVRDLNGGPPPKVVGVSWQGSGINFFPDHADGDPSPSIIYLVLSGADTATVTASIPVVYSFEWSIVCTATLADGTTVSGGPRFAFGTGD